jgi:hypothetical protein
MPDVPVAITGAAALRCHGVAFAHSGPIALIDGRDPGEPRHDEAEPSAPPLDGVRWWSLPDEGPLVRAAVRCATVFANTPCRVVTMPWWVTLTLCDLSADPRPAIRQALQAGVVPLAETRQLVMLRAGRGARHLLEDLIADAEWALMRARYASGEDVH